MAYVSFQMCCLGLQVKRMWPTTSSFPLSNMLNKCVMMASYIWLNSVVVFSQVFQIKCCRAILLLFSESGSADLRSDNGGSSGVSVLCTLQPLLCIISLHQRGNSCFNLPRHTHTLCWDLSVDREESTDVDCRAEG
ncbi:hypothetical protein XENORESO_008578 [Xenotaenia resolanae]|uniref:Uncharacterized protein n=1 Tax=Xenotaenia resolanae TaxID=208358 RepID=A0ABV0X279_9TELE